jgi:hypothetical protein
VRALAVLAEALAVVGGGEDERARERAPAFEVAQQPADLRVHERHFAVVRRGAKARGQVAGRLVGGVRVVVVQPEEKGRRRSGRGTEPAQRGVGGGIGGALDVRSAPRVVAAGQVVVVGREAAVETEAPVEREARDERRGPVSRTRELLGRRLHLRRHHVAAVVAHAMADRGEAGEHRGVRRTGEWHVRDGRREPHPARGQRIERGRHGRGVPVGAEMVRPQRVDGDEEDVRTRGAGGRRRGLTASGNGQGRGERAAQQDVSHRPDFRA